MLDRERLAVHVDRQHRVALVIGQRGEWRAAGPAVLGGLEHGVGVRAIPAGLGEDPREPDAAPPGVADQVAADLVGHAVEGDPVLGDPALDEVVVGEGQLVLDLAVDPQLPVLDRMAGGTNAVSIR